MVLMNDSGKTRIILIIIITNWSVNTGNVENLCVI